MVHDAPTGFTPLWGISMGLATAAAVLWWIGVGPAPARGPVTVQVSLPLPGAAEVRILAPWNLALGRDRQGHLYALDLTCPYLGCDLRWDALRGEFLCPCHGDRFAADGAVTAGSAPGHLSRFTVAEGGAGALIERRHLLEMTGTDIPPGMQYP